MKDISVTILPSLRLPEVKETFHLRFPAALFPGKLKTSALINGLDTYLRSSFSSDQIDSLLFCHRDDDHRTLVSSALAPVQARSILLGHHPYSFYSDEICRRQSAGIALFFCGESPRRSSLQQLFAHSLWQFNPAVQDELRSWARHCLQQEIEPLFSHYHLEKSLRAALSPGDFSPLNVAKISRNFLFSNLGKLLQQGSSLKLADADAHLLHGAWGLYGQSWTPGSSGQKRIIAAAEFSLSVAQLSFHAVDDLCSSIIAWLNKLLSTDSQKIPRIVISAASSALLMAFSSSLGTLRRDFSYKIAYPDLLFGCSPLQNFLRLWAEAEPYEVLVCAQDFPLVRCFIVTPKEA